MLNASGLTWPKNAGLRFARSAIVLRQGFTGDLMPNRKSPPRSFATPVSSSAVNVLDRVIAIARAPLLPGEREADYAAIAGRIIGASRPKHAIEEILIRDVIDLSWEVLGLRRVKAGILWASIGAGAEQALAEVGYSDLEMDTLSEKWATGDANARKEVDAILAKAGVTLDQVTAKTFESKMDVFERIDRMLASAEARRSNALREIDRHRDAASAAARNAIDEVEDVEFRDVETGEVVGEPMS
jgi:hypothetical protein